jgi:tRNA(fMet)-specific endonuclease VapC
LQRLAEYDNDTVAISTITLAELEFGVANSADPDRNRTALYLFASAFVQLPFTTVDAYHYGLIRAYLSKKGSVIGPYDMQIAAQALCRGMTMVTHNTREFERVPGLEVVDWVG